MNTTLTTTHGRHDHPPQPVYDQPQRPVRRVNLLDRAALHLGVALVKWIRRPLAVESRERRASRAEQYLAQVARERAAERWQRLSAPRL